MRRRTKRLIPDIYDLLFSAYGPQHWWPARNPMEVVIGAILTQNTAWTNVERAIANLRRAKCLNWRALRDLPQDRLAELIRPSGTYRVKAVRLRAFVHVLWSRFGGSLTRLLNGRTDEVRKRLLSIPGIGPETADSILLYAANRPVFVIDAYTLRVLRRHYLIAAPGRNAPPFASPGGARSRGAVRHPAHHGPDSNASRDVYEMAQRLFHTNLPHDAKLFNEYHALLVAVGKHHCRSRARCDGCPLFDLPHDASL